ncbi:hypothetical protein ES705_20274 [subsurface metagenome]
MSSPPAGRSVVFCYFVFVIGDFDYSFAALRLKSGYEEK